MVITRLRKQTSAWVNFVAGKDLRVGNMGNMGSSGCLD